GGASILSTRPPRLADPRGRPTAVLARPHVREVPSSLQRCVPRTWPFRDRLIVLGRLNIYQYPFALFFREQRLSYCMIAHDADVQRSWHRLNDLARRGTSEGGRLHCRRLSPPHSLPDAIERMTDDVSLDPDSCVQR